MSLAEKNIYQHIMQTGPISVADFMTMALYDPQYGYYRVKDPLGKQGDFTTSPEISQIFGEIIGIWIAATWQQLGSPSPVTLVETGPGRGTLMADILRATKKLPNFHNNLHVCLLEINERLIQEQQATLEPLRNSLENLSWHSSIDKVPNDTPVIFIGNEFFDALPIHQFVKTNEGWRERMINCKPSSQTLEFALSPPVSLPKILHKKTIKKIQEAPLGAVYEYCPTAIDITTQISERIAEHNGAALFIDYGYYENQLNDTFQAVKKHQYHCPLSDIGEADLTAHVDFSTLANTASQYNIRAQGNCTQKDFLHMMGIDLRSSALMQQANKKQQQDITTAVTRLTSPTQMGTLFKCLALTHSDHPPAYGFADTNNSLIS